MKGLMVLTSHDQLGDTGRKTGFWLEELAAPYFVFKDAKPMALVCHAPGVLRHVEAPSSKPLVEGKNVTGFTNGEEADVGLTKIVPFLVEDELLRLGAIYSKVKNWGVHTVKHDLLITGQNPASSGPAAKVLIDTLRA